MDRPVKIEPDQLPVVIDHRSESLMDLVRDLVNETAALLRSEADVIKLEMKESTRAMILDSIKALVFTGVALLGVLSLTAFLIIALGDLLSPEVTNVSGFWLSALIIGVLFTGIGGWLAYHYASRIGQEASLPKTKEEISSSREFVREEYKKMKEDVRPH